MKVYQGAVEIFLSSWVTVLGVFFCWLSEVCLCEIILASGLITPEGWHTWAKNWFLENLSNPYDLSLQ